MTRANIKSKKPYYVTKEGQVYNSKYELTNGSFHKKYKLHILTYVDENGINKSIPFTRLIYKTFYPQINIQGCTITRLKLNVENQYSLYNLERISNKDMPKKLGITLVQPAFELCDRTFYKNFNSEKMDELIKDLNNKYNTLSDLANKYSVSDMSIHRAKKKLLNFNDDLKAVC